MAYNPCLMEDTNDTKIAVSILSVESLLCVMEYTKHRRYGVM